MTSAWGVVFIPVLQGWVTVTLGHDTSSVHLVFHSHEDPRDCPVPVNPDHELGPRKSELSPSIARQVPPPGRYRAF